MYGLVSTSFRAERKKKNINLNAPAEGKIKFFAKKRVIEVFKMRPIQRNFSHGQWHNNNITQAGNHGMMIVIAFKFNIPTHFEFSVLRV